MHSVYMLYSRKRNRFYIGESDDPVRRVEYHNRGTQRYTKRADDWVLVFRKDVETPEEARSIEQSIKKSKSRKSILRWIRGPDNLIPSSVWLSWGG